MLSAQQLADILCRSGKGVVGGYGNEDGPTVAQMTFCRHGHRAVGNAVGQLRQSVAGAGGNDECIQQLFGSDGFSLRNSAYRFRVTDRYGTGDVFLCASKAAVRGVGCLRKNGNQGIFTGQFFHYRKCPCISTKGTA